MNKDVLLANPQNKQKFINNLRDISFRNTIQTLQAENDADQLIVKIVVESAIKYKTVLVGEDTDLLILLYYYVSSDANAIYLKPEQR